MRVMLDTNVLISAFVFDSFRMNKVIENIIYENKLILSSYVVDELKLVVEKKFVGKKEILDEFLTALPFELVYTPDKIDKKLFEIRDESDYPVLYSAILEDVDILITGDKDFFDVEIEKPEILTPVQYYEKYVRK